MIKPTNSNILIQHIEIDNSKTDSGIILATGSSKEKTDMAKIIAIGELVKDVAEGDVVVTNKYCGTNITYEENDYIICKEEDVLAIIE